MKRKFILLPITLTALAPAISLVGCGDPDTPEPEPIQTIELNHLTTGDYGEQLESVLIQLNTNTIYKLTADYSITSQNVFNAIALYDNSKRYDMIITPLEFKIDKKNLNPTQQKEMDDNCFSLRDYGIGSTAHIEIIFVCSTQTNNTKLEFSFKFWATPSTRVKFILFNRGE